VGRLELLFSGAGAFGISACACICAATTRSRSVTRALQELLSGTFALRLWPGTFDVSQAAHATCLSNPALDASVVTLSVRLPVFGRTVVRGGTGLLPRIDHSLHAGVVLSPEAIELASGYVSQRVSAADFPSLYPRILRIVGYDPLQVLEEDEARLIWLCRERLTGMPAALPKFLQAVRWDDAASVEEAYRLLVLWRPPSPIQALELLRASVPDRTVRGYAVSRLELLDDDELSAFMLQLVSVCRYEPFLDSSLVRFLLRRALSSPRRIGHQLFWLLKAELHVPLVAVRYSVMMQQFLEYAGEDQRVEFGRQAFVVQRLQEVARRVKAAGSRESRAITLSTELSSIVFPDRFQIPLAPEYSSSGVFVKGCRVMNSKKLPLMLVLEPGIVSAPHDVSPGSGGAVASVATPSHAAPGVGPRKKILFKTGDDLRQDTLTLQILGVMDRLWKAEGLDLCVSAYRTTSTGDGIGMLEVVEDAETLATIISKSVPGGRGLAHKIRAALAVYSPDNVYRDWLTAHQDSVQGGFATIEHNFLHSCAAYCVATYVLGIGDRHNDNIMLTHSGRLFHIDFGHFLGNFKKKYGYLRERTPFVFTPHMAAVIGGPSSLLFAQFEDLACRAFLILRQHGHTLITLFSLMVACGERRAEFILARAFFSDSSCTLASGLPELRSERDVDWLRSKLLLDASDAEAAAHLRRQIAGALSTRATQFNDACHLLKHA
jgi:phosphatidylinositol-4,5-bisphosphate 3-kinase catalytic subunit alpha/beta/delta